MNPYAKRQGKTNYILILDTYPNWKKRFWDKISISTPDECWEWLAALNSDGYPVFRLNKDKLEYAHRLSWIIENNQGIPTDHVVDHECKNRSCCNPNHLSLMHYIDSLSQGGTQTIKGDFNLENF